MYNLFDHPMVAFTMAFVRTQGAVRLILVGAISAVLIAAAVLIGKIVIDKVNGAGETVKNEQIPTAP